AYSAGLKWERVGNVVGSMWSSGGVAFEERIKLQKEGQVESQENLLFAHGENSKKGRQFSKRGGRSNFSRGNGKVIETNTTQKRNTQLTKENQSGMSEQSNLILKDDEPSLLITTHETEHEEVLLNEGQIQPGKYATADASIWYLHNGASNHMTGTKSHFRDIDESVTERVCFGDGSYVQIKGRGSILLGCKNNEQKIVSDTKPQKQHNKSRTTYGDRVPTRALVDKTPYEALYNIKPNLENLRIFGCTTYAKITIPHLKKLDDRSIPMIYLGVEEGSKACRIGITMERKQLHKTHFGLVFVVEGVDNENPTPVHTENNDNTYQEQEPIIDPDSPITPPAYTYNPNSEEKEEATIRLKWVFKTKRDAKGKIIKYKARLVAKGYVQEQGIDFDEVFASVARIKTVRLILVLAAYHGWQVHHLDVKSAFLHGDLKEEVYVTQPEGFIQQGNSGKVYKLTKALYGLRQALQAWNVKLDQTLKSLDFKKCNLKQAVYTKRSKTSTLIVRVYVDDLIITGTPRKEIDLFKF
nr:ribonuclease H-like domain, reverse transcriptase, RNA-dependent DNA polymerase [Tanacetum cinerariifolium]